MFSNPKNQKILLEALQGNTNELIAQKKAFIDTHPTKVLEPWQKIVKKQKKSLFSSISEFCEGNGCPGLSNPYYFSCRSIKDCNNCSLARDCVFDTDSSSCRSVQEMISRPGYEYLKVWKRRIYPKMGQASTWALNLAALQVDKYCKKTKDFRIRTFLRQRQVISLLATQDLIKPGVWKLKPKMIQR